MHIDIDKSITFCCSSMAKFFSDEAIFVPSWNGVKQNYIQVTTEHHGRSDWYYCPWCGEKIKTEYTGDMHD